MLQETTHLSEQAAHGHYGVECHRPNHKTLKRGCVFIIICFKVVFNFLLDFLIDQLVFSSLLFSLNVVSFFSFLSLLLISSFMPLWSDT